MKNITSFYLLLLFVCLGMQVQVQAQTNQLHGRVLDATTKKPLPFVTITNTANKKASQKSEADGNFSMTVTGRATLLFSYVGYKSHTVNVSPADTGITVTMETDISGLSEVVVIGYGQQQKIHTRITLNEFAEFANLSVSYFSTIFRERTGYAPVEYFNHLKVQKACQYLLLPDITIKEVAESLGMDDPYYFSRMFSKLMGVSPKEYRRRNRPEGM